MEHLADYVHPSLLLPRLAQRELGDTVTCCQSLLDIGGGSGVVGEDGWRKLGVNAISVADAWDGYDWKAYQDRIKFHCIPAQRALAYFGPGSFDVVQCCECIEHLPKEEGAQLLQDLKEITRRLVLMTCPDGYTYQDPGHAEGEPWKLNPYQLHLCGWTPPELTEAGYTVIHNGGLERDGRIVASQLISYYVKK